MTATGIRRARRRALRAVGITALAVSAACTTGGAESTTTTTTTTVVTSSTTTQPSTTTTEAPTTTSTTTEPTTTTEPATTTTTEPATTSTIAGTLVLAEGSVLSGGVDVPFGTGVDDTIDAVSAVLGPPTEDSGWIDAFSVYGTCPLPVIRGVHWDGFVALFTRSETEFAAEGVGHFFSWYYPYGDELGLRTEAGIGIGSTVSQLQAAYSGSGFVLVPWEFDDTQGFWSTRQFDAEQLYGYTTGLDPADTVTGINGGTGCGE